MIQHQIDQIVLVHVVSTSLYSIRIAPFLATEQRHSGITHRQSLSHLKSYPKPLTSPVPPAHKTQEVVFCDPPARPVICAKYATSPSIYLHLDKRIKRNNQKSASDHERSLGAKDADSANNTKDERRESPGRRHIWMGSAVTKGPSF